MAPLLDDLSERTEQERRLPVPTLRALHDASLFRLLLPAFLDEGEIDPVTFVQVIEEVARHDASAAWCLCQAAGCSMTAAYLRGGHARGAGPGLALPRGAGAAGRGDTSRIRSQIDPCVE